MNRAHLEFCGGEEWRDALTQWVIPNALDGTDLGDDVLGVGPGPALVTDHLRASVERLTVVEVDDALAAALRDRLAGTNVEVVRGDATSMAFEDSRFTGAVSFTMLRHVPTTELQDRLFAEVARVLEPGAPFVMSDSLASDELLVFHEGDTYNPVDPATVGDRLRSAGYADVTVRQNEYGWAAIARR